MRIGKINKPGSWELRYNYRKIKKDAVVGAFTCSDFGGGGTDVKGHEIGGAIQLVHNTTFKATCFINGLGLEEETTTDYSRLQFDVQVKF